MRAVAKSGSREKIDGRFLSEPLFIDLLGTDLVNCGGVRVLAR